jgi:hypothetical protein
LRRCTWPIVHSQEQFLAAEARAEALSKALAAVVNRDLRYANGFVDGWLIHVQEVTKARAVLGHPVSACAAAPDALVSVDGPASDSANSGCHALNEPDPMFTHSANVEPQECDDESPEFVEWIESQTEPINWGSASRAWRAAEERYRVRRFAEVFGPTTGSNV